MSKRPQIKGKGADVFLGESESHEEPTTQEKKKEKRVMVTFYLSPALVERLDQVWIKRRLSDRRAQKSYIVEEALKTYLRES